MLGADPSQSGPRFTILSETAAFASRSAGAPITASSGLLEGCRSELGGSAP